MYMDALRGYSTCLSLAGRSPPDRSSSKYLRYPPRKPLFIRPFSTTSHPSIHPSIHHSPSPIPDPVLSCHIPNLLLHTITRYTRGRRDVVGVPTIRCMRLTMALASP